MNNYWTIARDSATTGTHDNEVGPSGVRQDDVDPSGARPMIKNMIPYNLLKDRGLLYSSFVIATLD